MSAPAQTIESLIRPGEVIQGHAKWEEDCSKCHVRFDRAAQDRLCMDCHKDVGQDMRERTGFHGRQKAQSCRSCHTDHKGRTARIVELDKQKFDHAQSDFLLRGKHAKVECEKCHEPKKKYSQTASDCNACHRKDDVHKGSLGVKCADCHGESNWKDTNFDHGKTRFALKDKHADAKCGDCHKKGIEYKDAPRTCIGCHKTDDNNKGHKGLYGDRCDTCHGAKAWKPSTFHHDTDTRFLLRGKHRGAKCADCHAGSLYKDKVGTACIDCHKKDDDGAKGHKGSLGRDCAACHTEGGWKEKAKFDHDKTKFPLLGKHIDTKCDACHKSANHKEAPKDCIGCHKKDDKHEATLGTKCESCHVERDWKTTTTRFDHDKTKFKLRNAHAAKTVQCSACHSDLKHYRDTPVECVACHKKDDKHQGQQGTKCESCHSDRSWKVSDFDHSRTRFALLGKHSDIKCAACHLTLLYKDAPRDCYGCHKKDDKHEGQQGTKCESCHNARDWRVSDFDHQRTRFALVGKHVVVKCAACHVTPRYQDAPRDCHGCHKKDDKHKLKFGVACESCHNARAWGIWDYDHARRARFVLDGAHSKLACEVCHQLPAPAGKAAAEVGSTCIACHRKDDTHDGAFGAVCQQCHVSDNWKRIRNRVGASAQNPHRWASVFGAASVFTQLRTGRPPT